MGALDAVEAAGAAQLGGMRITAADGTMFEGRFAADHGFRGFRDRGLALRRETLDTILLARARAAGAEVCEGLAVDGVAMEGGRVTGVHVRDGAGSRTIHAPLVVGADGLRSVVGRRLGLVRRAWRPRRTAFVTHYRDVAGITECGEMHVTARGYCGLADVGGVTNVAVVVPERFARDAAGDQAAWLDRWIAAHESLAPRFAHATRVSAVRVTGPFAVRAARAWAPGAALVGDAADFFDPFTGEGIYAALRGGEMLGPYLYEALRAPTATRADEALAAYDRWRHHEFGGKWRVERLIGLAVAFPPLLNHAARALARRRSLADLLVGVAGDFVPAREVLRPGFLWQLLRPARGSAA